MYVLVVGAVVPAEHVTVVLSSSVLRTLIWRLSLGDDLQK